MIIYLAGKYSTRTTLLKVAALLTLNGHKVAGQWLTGVHTGTTPEEQNSYALIDLGDILKADVFVLIQSPEPSAGRHVEFGYAIANKKDIVLVGPSTCVFHDMLIVRHFETVQEFLDAFAGKARIED